MHNITILLPPEHAILPSLSSGMEDVHQVHLLTDVPQPNLGTEQNLCRYEVDKLYGGHLGGVGSSAATNVPPNWSW